MPAPLTYTGIELTAFAQPVDVTFMYYPGHNGSREEPQEAAEFEISSVKVHDVVHRIDENGKTVYDRGEEMEMICFLSDTLLDEIVNLVEQRYYEDCRERVAEEQYAHSEEEYYFVERAA